MSTATVILPAADQRALDALVEHGSPYADLFEREARRDARLAEIDREFEAAMRAYRGAAAFAVTAVPRPRMARTETRRPRRRLLARVWEWVTAA